jgi:hypothetical protein
MPILDRTESSFTQVCAACGASRTVPNTSVIVRKRDDYAVLELPPCACGAIEVLLPSIDEAEHSRPGSDGHLHQLAVDELSTRVRGHSPTNRQAEAIARWLPEDAKLTLPIITHA